MSEQASNETISETNPTDSSMTNKISELVDYVLSKSLLLFGLITVICIIILGIIIMIYCIIKKRKQSETHSNPGFGLKDKGAAGARHFEFKKLQNTSSFGGDVSSSNKESMSLSEIRIKNLQMENKNAVSNESVSERGKKKKKGKKDNVENVDEEKKVSQKKLEKEIKKQIGKYANQDE